MSTNPPGPGEGSSQDEPSAGDATAPIDAGAWTTPLRVLAILRRLIDRVLAVLCIVAFTALVVIVTWQVFTREVLNNSAPWTTEAASYMFVILAVFAAAYVFSERGHIAVGILVEKLPLGGQRIMAVVIELIVMFFILLVFIFGGLRVSANSWGQDLSTLPFSVGQMYLVLPIAGVIILFYSLAHLIGILAGVEKPTPDFDEDAEAI